MRLLVTGACGFAGSTLIQSLREATPDLDVIAVDNFMRPGSEINRQRLAASGVRVLHADVRVREDLDRLPAVDWVIDAAANPSVLAGTSSGPDSRLVMQHNLMGTINILELCRSHGAGLILLSTSRVYSIASLTAVALETEREAFRPVVDQAWPSGVGPNGVSEGCATSPPLSLYGASKLCSEVLALEYGFAFGFPVWINRLGVLAGAGQFGRADQGIVSFWIHACAAGHPLTFTGFGGEGFQVRDCLHPADLTIVLRHQMQGAPRPEEAVMNFSGGLANSFSLRQLHAWCEDRFGPREVRRDSGNRPFDVPWLVLDSSRALARWGWRPTRTLDDVLGEIANHAEANPQWLAWTTP